MRLIQSFSPENSRGSRRLARSLLCVGAVSAALLARGAVPEASAQPAGAPPNPDDLLGNIVVVAGATRSLPKVGVLPSLASELEDVTLRSVVRRDLDLCGEFEVLPDSAAPEGLYLSDSPVDVKAWAAKGVEAVVKVSAKPLPGGKKAELRGLAYFVNRGTTPVFDKGIQVDASQVREESHRIADVIIGALTGKNGGFASHMTFASGSGKLRRVYTMDADGNDAKAVSPPEQMAISPAFGKGEQVYYAASVNNEEFKVRTPSAGPFDLGVKGSVYGIAFSKDRSRVALSIGVGSTIKVFTGPDFAAIQPASEIGMAMQPTFTPSGKLAFVGEGKYGQRVYVDGKAISPDGLMASAPTFCDHPDGTRAVFAVGVGKNLDLVATGENGGQLGRLTQNQGRNSYPACSPDGRLVAFFSTRTGNEGPGLYMMRVDGGRPKRISTLLGDSLRWDPLPPPKQSAP
jgi:TolB protein